MKVNVNAAHLRAALHAAGNKDLRPYLNGVFVEVMPGEVRCVATNGHMAVCLRAASDTAHTGSVIVPRDTIKAMKTKASPVEIDVSDDGKVGFVSYDNHKSAFAPVDGVFPSYRRIMPVASSDAPATFAPDLYHVIGKIAKELGASPSAIWLRQNGAHAAAFGIYGCDQIAGVIMPMRPPKDYCATPLPQLATWAAA